MENMTKIEKILVNIVWSLWVSFVSIIVGAIVTALLIDFINWEFVITPNMVSDPLFWRIIIIFTPLPALLECLIKIFVYLYKKIWIGGRVN